MASASLPQPPRSPSHAWRSCRSPRDPACQAWRRRGRCPRDPLPQFRASMAVSLTPSLLFDVCTHATWKEIAFAASNEEIRVRYGRDRHQYPRPQRQIEEPAPQIKKSASAMEGDRLGCAPTLGRHHRPRPLRPYFNSVSCPPAAPVSSLVRHQPGGRSSLSPTRCLPVELWRTPARARVAGGGGAQRRVAAAEPVHWPPIGMVSARMVPAVDWLQRTRGVVASNLCISSLLSYSRR
jgi:hypothetical protein